MKIQNSRYEAMLGANTKQFWLYDNENDTYIDIPKDIINELEEIRWNGDACIETADSIEEAQEKLIELVAENPSWLHDGYEYDAEEIEI